MVGLSGHGIDRIVAAGPASCAGPTNVGPTSATGPASGEEPPDRDEAPQPIANIIATVIARMRVNL
jgi:hypothetical protein